jgi:hypothetical protein
MWEHHFREFRLDHRPSAILTRWVVLKPAQVLYVGKRNDKLTVVIEVCGNVTHHNRWQISRVNPLGAKRVGGYE